LNEKESKIYSIFFLFSCHNKETKKVEDLKPFFNFDQVYHYKLNPSNKDFPDLYFKNRISARGRLILDGDLSDSLLFKDLDQLALKPVLIDPVFYNEINTKIFVQYPCKDPADEAIQPIYTDILVFKKTNMISAIAKVSFATGSFISKGQTCNTDCFNHTQFNELELLRKLLEKNYSNTDSIF